MIPRYTRPRDGGRVVGRLQARRVRWTRVELLAVEGWSRPLGSHPAPGRGEDPGRGPPAPRPRGRGGGDRRRHPPRRGRVRPGAGRARSGLRAGGSTSASPPATCSTRASRCSSARATDLILDRLDHLIFPGGWCAAEPWSTATRSCMGRTHGVHAEPTTFGHNMRCSRPARPRLPAAAPRARGVARRGLSGVVGPTPRRPQEEQPFREFGLRPRRPRPRSSSATATRSSSRRWRSSRPRSKSQPTEIRPLPRTEIRECRIRSRAKGSSAMPQKPNPTCPNGSPGSPG